ncbi:7281_t:CDS:2, partial [Gigaspora margarita]
YDFLREHKQKLIPSIYLTIGLEDSNNSLSDIMLIMKNPVLNNALKLENEFNPILVLLVDGDLMRTPAYNPVKHSMFTLSENIIENINLAKQNFHYSSKRLCDIWQQNYINSKEVIVEYLDEQINLFNKASDISWGWIEDHYQMC